MSGLLDRVGRFCYRARRRVVASWLLVAVCLGAAAATLSGPTVTSFSLPGTESQQAFDLLDQRFGGTPLDGGSARVVFVAEDGRVTDPGVRDHVREVVGEISDAPQVAQAADPYESGAISEDGRTALVDVLYRVPFAEIDPASRDALLYLAEEAEQNGLSVEVGGDAVEAQPEVGPELVGLAVAALVLFLTFGSLLAAGMPLVTGITGVLIGLLGVTAASGFVDLGATTPILALMLGLAVGIDYALFVVSRFRHELAGGLSPEDAIGRALGTAGSAVVFAGLTVVIALAGLSVVGIGLLTEMGLAAAGTVLVTVVVALTLLPALLGFAGDRVVGRRRVTGVGDGARPTRGQRWVGALTRRPWTALIAGVVGLGVLALPALDLRLGLPDQGTYPQHTTQRAAYDAISAGFGPGFNGPLLVVVDAADAPEPAAAVERVAGEIRRTPGVVHAAVPEPNPAGDTAVIGVVPTTGPDDVRTEELVGAIRGDVRDQAEAAGATIAVTGTTALLIDFNDRMAEALWIYLAVVIGLSLLLLMLVFRSLLVPLTATLGFLLSVGATFGALVAVFQWGWLDAVGIHDNGAVVSMLPIFIVGVVFGLAMDYQVFLVTRMREEFVHGADPVAAVRVGYRHGAPVVVAAAIIMVSVFGGFVLGEATDIIQIGLALAVAVAVDAFVVRLVIVPAAMTLLGRRAWWLPRWLDRLVPNLDVEGEQLRRGSPSGDPAARV